MELALYLLPVTLGDTPIETVLPPYNKEIILGIRYFIVEDVRSARRFLKKVDKGIDIDALTFYIFFNARDGKKAFGQILVFFFFRD